MTRLSTEDKNERIQSRTKFKEKKIREENKIMSNQERRQKRISMIKLQLRCVIALKNRTF